MRKAAYGPRLHLRYLARCEELARFLPASEANRSIRKMWASPKLSRVDPQTYLDAVLTIVNGHLNS